MQSDKDNEKKLLGLIIIMATLSALFIAVPITIFWPGKALLQNLRETPIPGQLACCGKSVTAKKSLRRLEQYTNLGPTG